MGISVREWDREGHHPGQVLRHPARRTGHFTGRRSGEGKAPGLEKGSGIFAGGFGKADHELPLVTGCFAEKEKRSFHGSGEGGSGQALLFVRDFDADQAAKGIGGGGAGGGDRGAAAWHTAGGVVPDQTGKACLGFFLTAAKTR